MPSLHPAPRSGAASGARVSERPLVAIVGNPNVGKTTLFNALTGARAKVGNYPGITVDRRVGSTQVDGLGDIELVDVPGTYSLVARTGEEQIAIAALLGLQGNPTPDLAVVCVDATQLVRSSYVLTQIRELGIEAVVALTMTDEAGDASPDITSLAGRLGVPVVPTLARQGRGLIALRDAIGKAITGQRQRETGPDETWRWRPSPELDARLDSVAEHLPGHWPQSRAMALWALLSIEPDDELIDIPDSLRRAALDATGNAGESIDDEVISARYSWLDQQIAPLLRGKIDRSFTERVDRVLLNRFVGFGVFLGLMFVVFQALFAWADPAITLIEEFFGWAGNHVADLLGPGLFTSFLVDGLIAGVGGVIVFLPQILLLFFFIGLMEDSGYMARVAYLMDRIMKAMNLHGRAFVPMMSGFACAVPAILATRTMERQRDRLLTMMVVPLMTCSARLPVYTLVIATLFPVGHVAGFLPVQGLLMVAMYLFSTVTALVAAWVLSRSVKPLRAKRLPFVLELPPYRLPRLRDVGRMMWDRTSYFLREAGTVITVATILLWALLAFPRHLDNPSRDYDALLAAADTPAAVAEIEQARDGERLRASYGGQLGHAIEPVIEPLGFDWKIGVGIIGAFAAREVFVSTMGVVYSVGDEVDEEDPTLRQRIRAERRADGAPVYTPLVGLSLMIFFALACQCVSTLAVVKRETGGFRWPLFLFAYMTGLAWIASFAVYQGGRLLGFG